VNVLGDRHGVQYAYRNSFFDFGYKVEDVGGREYYTSRQHDICDFDYYIVDKVSAQQVLAQYNILVATELLKNEHISVVFDNPMTTILKNSQRGLDCLPAGGVVI